MVLLKGSILDLKASTASSLLVDLQSLPSKSIAVVTCVCVPGSNWKEVFEGK